MAGSWTAATEKSLTREKERNNFNALFLRRFWRLLHVMFPSITDETVLLFLFLLIIVILEQLIIYQVGILPSKYYQVLGDKDMDGFKSTTILALIIVTSIAFVLATEKYVCSVLYIKWREYITRFLHSHYFTDLNFYHLNLLDNTIDNPDQRITQDVDKMTNEFSQIIAQLLISPFTIAYYLYQSWLTAGYLGPVCVVAFFLVSTIINKILMSPVVDLIFRQERREGDFRFKHMQIRVNAESAAFLRSGPVERYHTDRKLNLLLNTQQHVVKQQYPLTFAVKSADYLGSILSYIIVGIPIFAGAHDDLVGSEVSALISRNSFYVMYLINCFTKLIDMAVQVVEIAGTTHRIMQMVERLDDVPDEWSRRDTPPLLNKSNHSEFSSDVDYSHEPQNNGKYVQPGSHVNTLVDSVSPINADTCLLELDVAYELSNVTYGAPDSNTPLVKELTLRLESGRNILITGDSGCGKSSLLRVLGGLWPLMAGDIRQGMPHSVHGIFYLPQKPYFTDGSLRSQIIFPLFNSTGHVDECQHLVDLLEVADLQHLLERTCGLDYPVSWSWYDVLSPGEMQRLSFVRLFYHKPSFAVMDEATSQMGLEMEERLYRKCAELSITVISVGHRASVQQFHDTELHLTGDGRWTFSPLFTTSLRL